MLLTKESYRIELLLKLLVGVVDAELLKTVHIERLKPTKKRPKKMSRRLIIWYSNICSFALTHRCPALR